MPTFEKALLVAEAPINGIRLIEVDGTKIALCGKDGRFFALSNFCPHLTGNLSEGVLEDDVLVCPEHGWRFKLATGRCVTMPGRNAHTFPIKIEEGWILVGV